MATSGTHTTAGATHCSRVTCGVIGTSFAAWKGPPWRDAMRGRIRVRPRFPSTKAFHVPPARHEEFVHAVHDGCGGLRNGQNGRLDRRMSFAHGRFVGLVAEMTLAMLSRRAYSGARPNSTRRNA